jgi:hypothetical protein
MSMWSTPVECVDEEAATGSKQSRVIAMLQSPTGATIAAADDPLDQISGTTGLAGSADTVLVLDRTEAGTVLHGRGRDIEEFRRAVQFDQGTCTWTVLGEAGSVQSSGERAAMRPCIAT